jgi:hypothetical protein
VRWRGCSSTTAIGDQRSDGTALASVRDHPVQIRMQQWFSAAEGDNCGAEIGQPANPLEHRWERHRFGSFVVFVAIAAVQIATALLFPESHRRLFPIMDGRSRAVAAAR